MFITPAFAQGLLGGDSGGFIVQLLPFILIFVVMWFLIFRPQQKRVKEHRDMVASLRRGDTVVTSGGLVGKISKVVDDREIQVEIAEGTRVRVVRSMIAEVRTRGEPISDSPKKG
jgi:preprotein translocase subunit YajC